MTLENPCDTQVALDVLPVHIREHLYAFNESLEKIFGTSLVGVILHGSVARGEYRPGQSNVDALVILTEAPFDKLEAMGEPLQRARYDANLEVIMITEGEIRGAADAFPLFYDEIKQRHILLSGRDHFANIEVHDTHRRLRIEQELREAQFWLRRAVTDALGAREAIGGAVGRKVRQIRAALLALLSLKGIACPPDFASVLAKTGEVYGVDVQALSAAREAPILAHAALVELLDKAIADVNAMG
ncbi:MAG: nucleotidyltransferase domain-containing protein [Polyangiaceae bacterium]|nr:nucleotidyltransferase domain-containing protein [Polyangiaceae bacterium]